MLMTFEEKVAAASESAAADAYRAAFDPPPGPMQPQHMTADEHANSLRYAIRHKLNVRYRGDSGLLITKPAEDFVQEHAYEADGVNALLLAAERVVELGGSDSAIAEAFREYRRIAIEHAGKEAAAIETSKGRFIYLPARSLS